MIPESKWKWCGFAGHHIWGHHCTFHLTTHVGKYRISTVGAYYPPTQAEDSREMEEVGLHRFYETFVFKTSGKLDKECRFCKEVTQWCEIDALASNDYETANANHIKMCKKYARQQ